jgi:hypothetical protein
MSTLKGAASSVLERFPDDWHVIVQLCKDDEDFRELCDHYSECQAVLAQLNDSSCAGRDRLREYETLMGELEQEIRGTIQSGR